jgi:hypothetical protein
VEPVKLLGGTADAARASFLRFVLRGAGGSSVASLRAALLALLLAVGAGDVDAATLPGASDFAGQESSVKSSLTAAKRNLWQVRVRSSRRARLLLHRHLNHHLHFLVRHVAALHSPSRCAACSTPWAPTPASVRSTCASRR